MTYITGGKDLLTFFINILINIIKIKFTEKKYKLSNTFQLRIIYRPQRETQPILFIISPLLAP